MTTVRALAASNLTFPLPAAYHRDSRCHSALGLALAGLGEKAAGIAEGKAAVDAMPVTKDAWRAASRLEDLARISLSASNLTRLRGAEGQGAGGAVTCGNRMKGDGRR